MTKPRGQAVENRMPPVRRTTMADVAQAAGVSKTTVSHVLNGSRFVSDEVRAEVLAAVKALRYRPNSLARALRRRETGTIGLLVPNVNSPLAALILGELDAMATSSGLGVIVAQSNYSLERERDWLSILTTKQLDVLLVWSVMGDSESLTAIHQDGQPLIRLVSTDGEGAFPTVAADFAAAGAIGMMHLLDHGYRRIAVLLGRRHLGDQALQGAQSAIDALDGTAEIVVDRSDDVLPAAHASMQQLFETHREFDAILTLSSIHLEALLSLRDRSRQEPLSDPAIVAMSDQTWLQYLNPSVTSVRQDAHGIAQAAITMIRQLLAGEEIGDESMVFSPSVELGTSCGCTSTSLDGCEDLS
jgi:LacI family transcriptional regulator